MGSLGIMPSIDISASGLSAMRRRLNAIASNIANVETSRTDEGGPYKRKLVSIRQGNQQADFPFLLHRQYGRLATTQDRHLQDLTRRAPGDFGELTGVESEMTDSDAAPRMVFDPGHPDADANGYVAMPDINIVQEMVDMIIASRAYEANVTVINADKELVKKALEI